MDDPRLLQMAFYGEGRGPPMLYREPHSKPPPRPSKRRKLTPPQPPTDQIREQLKIRASAIQADPNQLLSAGDLPGDFPPELAYRALAAYSLLRTLSITLRLSPFTPNVFLRALYLPYPNNVMGQVHTALLRVLLPNLNLGYTYKSKGRAFHKRRSVDNVRWPVRGGDNLTYLDGLSWPLFYDDYCHLTADRLYASYNDEELHLDFRLVGMQPDMENYPYDYRAFDDDDEEEDEENTGSHYEERSGNMAASSNSDSLRRLLQFQPQQQQQAQAHPQQPLGRGQRTGRNQGYAEVHHPNSDSEYGDDGEEEDGDSSDEDEYRRSWKPRGRRPSSNNGKRKRPSQPTQPPQNTRLSTPAPVAKKSPPPSESKVITLEVPVHPSWDPSTGTKAEPVQANEIPIKEDPSISKNLFDSSKNDLQPKRVLLEDVIAQNKDGRGPVLSGTGNKATPGHAPVKAHSRRRLPTSSKDQSHSNPQAEFLQQAQQLRMRQQQIAAFTMANQVPGGPNTISMGPYNAYAMAMRQQHQQLLMQQMAVLSSTASTRAPAGVPASRLEGKPRRKGLEVEDDVAKALRNFMCGTDSESSGGPNTKEGTAGTEDAAGGFEQQMHDQRWIHFEPLKKMRTGVPYHRLSPEDKVIILEFLIDQLLSIDEISAEFSKRKAIGDCYTVPYGKWPTNEEYENLDNDDECGVCGGEGELLCCDGCVASYHRGCLDMPLGQQLPEGKWLCPECRLVDPALFGPLRGGAKSSLDWFSVTDIQESARIEDLRRHEALVTPTYSQQDGTNSMLLAAGPPPLPQKANTQQAMLDGREFLILHGFVFSRSENQAEIPLRVLSKELVRQTLDQMDISVRNSWPFAQIPTAQGSSAVHFRVIRQYLLPLEAFDPNFYNSKYNRAPIPPWIKAGGGTQVTNLMAMDFESQCTKSSTFRLSEAFIRDFTLDALISKSLRCEAILFDPYHLFKGYMVRLESMFRRACLVSEFWEAGREKTKHDMWLEKVRKAGSVNRLARLLLLLVDCAHPRAFADGWYHNPHIKGDEVGTDAGRHFDDLPPDWTAKQESRKRAWERTPNESILRVCEKEGCNLDFFVQGIREHVSRPLMLSRSKRKTTKHSAAKPDGASNVLNTESRIASLSSSPNGAIATQSSTISTSVNDMSSSAIITLTSQASGPEASANLLASGAMKVSNISLPEKPETVVLKATPESTKGPKAATPKPDGVSDVSNIDDGSAPRLSSPNGEVGSPSCAVSTSANTTLTSQASVPQASAHTSAPGQSKEFNVVLLDKSASSLLNASPEVTKEGIVKGAAPKPGDVSNVLNTTSGIAPQCLAPNNEIATKSSARPSSANDVSPSPNNAFITPMNEEHIMLSSNSTPSLLNPTPEPANEGVLKAADPKPESASNVWNTESRIASLSCAPHGEVSTQCSALSASANDVSTSANNMFVAPAKEPKVVLPGQQTASSLKATPESTSEGALEVASPEPDGASNVLNTVSRVASLSSVPNCVVATQTSALPAAATQMPSSANNTLTSPDASEEASTNASAAAQANEPNAALPDKSAAQLAKSTPEPAKERGVRKAGDSTPDGVSIVLTTGMPLLPNDENATPASAPPASANGISTIANTALTVPALSPGASMNELTPATVKETSVALPDKSTASVLKASPESAEEEVVRKAERPKKKRRLDTPASNRRRTRRSAGRYSTAVKEADTASEATPKLELGVKKALAASDTMESQIEVFKLRKVPKIEKIVKGGFQKQLEWPICGRILFATSGNLPPREMKRLGRNGGVVKAPHVAYQTTHEVGQICFSHIWRKETEQCYEFEDLILQLRVLESFLDRSTIQSCENVVRRGKAQIQKVVKITKRDPANGIVEHFVVSKGKRKGCWISSEHLDVSGLILDAFGRRQNQMNKRNQYLEEQKERAEKERREKERAKLAAEHKARQKVVEQKARQKAAEQKARQKAAEDKARQQAAEDKARQKAAEQKARQKTIEARAMQAKVKAQIDATQQVVSPAVNQGKSNQTIAQPHQSSSAKAQPFKHDIRKWNQDSNAILMQHQMDMAELIQKCLSRGVYPIPEANLAEMRKTTLNRLKYASSTLINLNVLQINDEQLATLVSSCETEALQKLSTPKPSTSQANIFPNETGQAKSASYEQYSASQRTMPMPMPERVGHGRRQNNSFSAPFDTAVEDFDRIFLDSPDKTTQKPSGDDRVNQQARSRAAETGLRNQVAGQPVDTHIYGADYAPAGLNGGVSQSYLQHQQLAQMNQQQYGLDHSLPQHAQFGPSSHHQLQQSFQGFQQQHYQQLSGHQHQQVQPQFNPPPQSQFHQSLQGLQHEQYRYSEHEQHQSQSLQAQLQQLQFLQQQQQQQQQQNSQHPTQLPNNFFW